MLIFLENINSSTSELTINLNRNQPFYLYRHIEDDNSVSYGFFIINRKYDKPQNKISFYNRQLIISKEQYNEIISKIKDNNFPLYQKNTTTLDISLFMLDGVSFESYTTINKTVIVYEGNRFTFEDSPITSKQIHTEIITKAKLDNFN